MRVCLCGRLLAEKTENNRGQIWTKFSESIDYSSGTIRLDFDHPIAHECAHYCLKQSYQIWRDDTSTAEENIYGLAASQSGSRFM